MPTFTDIRFLDQNQIENYDHDNLVSSVQLSCTVAVEGSFSFTWKGPNGTIITNKENKTQILTADTTRTSILKIHQISLTDNGTYSCEASYSARPHITFSNAAREIALMLKGNNKSLNLVQISTSLLFIIMLHCIYNYHLFRFSILS